ncbi:hypothetical protein KKH13_05100 [Patescibacteria group bacterium]|nr:hypothetical protein [Patescibacteria group bacterium]
MNIVIPIGGKGQRFVEKGYKTPKPFIRIGNNRIIDRVMGCYPKGIDYHMYIVARREYASELPFGTFLISEETRGPVETIVASHELIEKINSSDELLIADCDSLIESGELMEALDYFRWEGASGGVTTRFCTDPACSYAEVDEHGNVLRTAEKVVISAYSTTGPYWFAHGLDFMYAARNGGSHVSPLYNHLISRNLLVKAYPVSSFEHLGTPEALEAYAYNNRIPITK